MLKFIIAIVEWCNLNYGFTFLVLTVFLIMVAFLQWRTTEIQRKQNLFEMRYTLFKSLTDVILAYDKHMCEVWRNETNYNREITTEFMEVLNKYEFLLKKEDVKTIKDLYSKSIQRAIDIHSKPSLDEIIKSEQDENTRKEKTKARLDETTDYQNGKMT
jgi:hypothetical protein